MTRYEVGLVGSSRAIRSYAEDIVRWGLVNRPLISRPGSSPTPRDRAFHEYLKKVRRIMKQDSAVFEVIDNRPMLNGEHSSVRELTLCTTASVEPGDMLHVWWRNSPEKVAAHVGSLSEGTYWTTPIPHRPSRRQRHTAEELASSVLDLSLADGSASVEDLPRITPRFFTTSDEKKDDEGSTVRIQVTYVDSWPRRAAAFLHSLQPGDAFEARVLPHPHRVPLDVPGGLAIATGSGAASVFAALRNGGQGVHLIWGLGDKKLEPWVQEELDQHLSSRALANLEIASSPTRVTDILSKTENLPDYATKWIYVSGNEHMGNEVDRLLGYSLGAKVLVDAAASRAYIVST